MVKYKVDECDNMILMDCNDVVLGSILTILRNILNIVWILGPLLAIVSLVINITKLVKDPDDKKVPKKIKNSILALILLFFVPTIVNAAMYMLDDKTELSACWAGDIGTINSDAKYIDPHKGNKKKSIFNSRSDYESGDKKSTDDSSGTSINACGSLEYCNKFLTSMYNNSKKLNDAILKNRASVVYSNSGDPKSWSEAIKVAEAGKTVKISCNRPSHWGMRDITGEYRDFWSLAAGGFKNYGGPMTKYTKQLKFDGSMSVKEAIKKGMIGPGDIIGVKAHTFAIYSVNKKDGSAVVFDGGHKFTNKCQRERKCSPMFTYSSGTNAGYRLYQIIRWVK